MANPGLHDLLKSPPGHTQAAAEQANLCLDGRISGARQAAYEAQVAAASSWADWRGHHARYVRNEVRRRWPLSAAFTVGEPSLRPGIEPNQWLLRVERINDLLTHYGTESGRALSVQTIEGWISAANRPPAGARPQPGSPRWAPCWAVSPTRPRRPHSKI